MIFGGLNGYVCFEPDHVFRIKELSIDIRVRQVFYKTAWFIVLVIAAMVEGLSYKMIAVRLGISLETVRRHIKNIYCKLQVNSKAEVIIKSLKGEL